MSDDTRAARAAGEPAATSAPLPPPSVFFRGDHIPAGRIAEWAQDWKRQLAGEAGRPLCVVLDNHPESVALPFAVSGLASFVVVLPPDPRAWPAPDAWPPEALLCLPPHGAERAERAARSRGIDVRLLETARPASPGPLGLTGYVIGFTSGSTGVPKPVCRRLEGSVATSRSMTEALGCEPGEGVLGFLTGANLQALTPIARAAVLGGELGLPERSDPRTLLAWFAIGRFRVWTAPVAVARMVAECPLDGAPPRSPDKVTATGTRLPFETFRFYRDRFGVPLRPAYGTTELGAVTVDYGPAHEVDPESVGRPIGGAEVRVDHDGRVWARTAWVMEGYGYPPDLEGRPDSGGWLATSDRGRIDASGRLHIEGRLDARFKTTSGHLLDPALVEAALARHPAVTAAAAFPLAAGPGRAGARVGVVVECADDLRPEALRSLIAESLPEWARPQTFVLVARLPRTSLGKVDTRACKALLQ